MVLSSRSKLKTAAVILLFGFLTYFTETIALPLADKCPVASNESCCAKIAEGKCMMAGRQNKQAQKPASGCNNAGICLDCPLCYTMVPVNHNQLVTPFILYKPKYVTAESNIMPGYAAAKWKPPITG